MNIGSHSRRVAWATLLLMGGGCADASSPPPYGTPTMREALFDSLLARTVRREAWSPPKNEALGFDPVAAMDALRPDVVGADSEEALFYALERLSNARRDRHLNVALVPGGIRPSRVEGLEVWGGGAVAARAAPVRVLPDYGTRGGYFVSDVADHPAAEGLTPGARLLRIQGMTVEAWEKAATPYTRHSTVAGLRWKLAEGMTSADATLPPDLRRGALELEVEEADGPRTYRLPYVAAGGLAWRGTADPVYPGMRWVRNTPTYDLHVDAGGAPVLLLRWYGFRETMVADVDALVRWAERNQALDFAVIVDATASRGGSLGAYALQRLQPRPFKTTFGTLRLSDVFPAFLEEKRREFEARDINDGGVPETVDDGTWLLEWLENEALPAHEAGVDVTEPVPFKLAHAPRGSDGVLQPAPVHFRGPFVLLLGPKGGSHLDQFASIVKDNGLGPILGMPAGGYSNTWEWEEVVTFPGTDRRVLGFMWSIGHTIRPNGEILEGNPAAVDRWIPLTAENAPEYHARLLEEARAYLRSSGHSAGSAG